MVTLPYQSTIYNQGIYRSQKSGTIYNNKNTQQIINTIDRIPITIQPQNHLQKRI